MENRGLGNMADCLQLILSLALTSSKKKMVSYDFNFNISDLPSTLSVKRIFAKRGAPWEMRSQFFHFLRKSMFTMGATNKFHVY